MSCCLPNSEGGDDLAIVHFVNYQKPQTYNTMSFVLQYTMRDDKTVADDGNKYVTGVNCTPQSAYTEFNNTKRLYGKTEGRLFYHFVQSFSVDENISPQTHTRNCSKVCRGN